MNGRELVRRLWESFEAREWDAARRVFTEDVVNYAEGWAFETEDGPIARVARVLGRSAEGRPSRLARPLARAARADIVFA